MRGRLCGRTALLAVVLSTAWLPAACGAADGPPKPRGETDPIFPADSVPWIAGHKPVTEKDVAGKVVLIDFWCYTCVNCIRTLPYIKEWHKRYAKHGLVIIGIHAPEFEFEKTAANVEAAIKQFGLEYPQCMDNDKYVWNCFNNKFWPAKYIFDDGAKLFDQKGGVLGNANRRALHEHFGEGEYIQTELQIQDLLVKKGVKAADLPKPMKPVNEIDALEHRGGVCYPVTRELYTNFRGFQQEQWGTDVELGRSKRYGSYEDGEFTLAGRRRIEGRAYLTGTWQVCEEYVRHPVETKEATDALLIRYKAVEVNAVIHLHAGKGPVLVKVTLDGKPLPKEKAGEDIVFEGGDSFVKIVEPKMYRIVKSPEYGEHDLAFWPKDSGFALYAFTFGSCLKPGAKPIIPGLPEE